MNPFLKKSVPALLVAIYIGVALFPIVAQAVWTPGQPVVPCKNDCTFAHLILLGKNVMDILIYISIPLAAILFAYAGGVLIFSGGNEEARKKAKAIFWSAGVGLCIMLVAYIIVYTIATALLEPKFYQGFFGGTGQQQQQQNNNTF